MSPILLKDDERLLFINLDNVNSIEIDSRGDVNINYTNNTLGIFTGRYTDAFRKSLIDIVHQWNEDEDIF